MARSHTDLRRLIPETLTIAATVEQLQSVRANLDYHPGLIAHSQSRLIGISSSAVHDSEIAETNINPPHSSIYLFIFSSSSAPLPRSYSYPPNSNPLSPCRVPRLRTSEETQQRSREPSPANPAPARGRSSARIRGPSTRSCSSIPTTDPHNDSTTSATSSGCNLEREKERRPKQTIIRSNPKRVSVWPANSIWSFPVYPLSVVGQGESWSDAFIFFWRMEYHDVDWMDRGFLLNL